MTKKPFTEFTPARWRGVVFPQDVYRDGREQVVALSFDTPEGIIRLMLDAESAEVIGDACINYRAMIQSSRSSGMPNSEMSPADGQKQAPPATSSAATRADE